MAGAAVVVIKHTVGAKVERSVGVDEVVLLASGSRVVAKAKEPASQPLRESNRCVQRNFSPASPTSAERKNCASLFLGTCAAERDSAAKRDSALALGELHRQRIAAILRQTLFKALTQAWGALHPLNDTPLLTNLALPRVRGRCKPSAENQLLFRRSSDVRRRRRDNSRARFLKIRVAITGYSATILVKPSRGSS